MTVVPGCSGDLLVTVPMALGGTNALKQRGMP